MAHHKSAKKRIRSNAAKKKRGQSYISSVRTAVKSFTAAVAKGADSKTLQSTLSAAQRLLAKASTKGLIHKNTAARKTSRLAKMMKKAESGVGTADATPAKKSQKGKGKA